MPTLTSLPLFLQSRILAYLNDEEEIAHRAQLHRTIDHIPCRRPETQISLDGVHTVNDPLPGGLLAPALASPVLAAAARKLFDGRLCFLTDLNTGGRLSRWVNAFSGYVQAITVIDVGEKWRADLSPDMSSVVSEKLCCEAVGLFKEITTNDVRLKVLDIVHVPFHECGRGMEDTMMTGLCATLESCQSSLKELALPVHHKSELCARALETVTLPHLTVFSIEMRRLSKVVSNKRRIRTGPFFLRMMQAVDGHADRAHGLTTLSELRLISVDDMPCTTAEESGCSAGFFRGIKRLLLNTDHNHGGYDWDYGESQFCSWFSEVESLYRSGTPCRAFSTMIKLRKKLKEVHFSHHHLRTGKLSADISKWCEKLDIPDVVRVMNITYVCKEKLKTLVTHGPVELLVARIANRCPYLEHVSLFITEENTYELPQFMEACAGLKVLEMMIDDRDFRAWEQLGKGIPRNHKNLRVVEIQTGPRYARKAVCVDIAVGCFLKIVKQIGTHVEKVIFRISAKVRTSTHAIISLCHMMVCCMTHAKLLQHVELDIVPRNPVKQGAQFSEACKLLRECREVLVAFQPRLKRINLGMWHYLLYTFVE